MASRPQRVPSPATQISDAYHFTFPENRSPPWEGYFSSRSSGEKKQLRVSSVLLLNDPPSPDVSLNDLLVVATPARLDPRPGRSHSGAMRGPCVQEQEAYSHGLISGQKGCERD